MANQRLSTLDFAKLTEETDRLAEHVAAVRRRMMEAAVRKEQRSRMGFHVVVSGETKPAAEPAPAMGEKQPPSSSRVRTSASKRPVSGVFAVVRDISAGRYSLIAHDEIAHRQAIAHREAPGSEKVIDLPSVVTRKVSA
jgi:hypothetical protein